MIRQNANEAKRAINQKHIADLAAKCSAPEAQGQIEKIMKNILADNQPKAKHYSELKQKRSSLISAKSDLETLKKSVDLWVIHDSLYSKQKHKSERKYTLRSTAPNSFGGGISGSGQSSSANSKLPLPVQIIVNAFQGDAKAVPLVVSIHGNEEYDFYAMTPEQIEMVLTKIKIEQSL